MIGKKIVKAIAKWTIPAGFQEIILTGLRRLRIHGSVSRELKTVLGYNRVFQNAHTGERCFILGTGPSINKQNLVFLKHESCISLNDFYYHKDYSTIESRYHIISGLYLHPSISNKLGLQYFHEVQKKTADASLFLNFLDRQFVLQNNIFGSRKVYYLHFTAPWNGLLKNGIDATKPLYPSQSVSIMALQLAVYMGFKEIYLLGLDHDWVLRFSKCLPTHFYRPEDSILERGGFCNDWIETDWEQEFFSYWNLWRQYKLLKRVTEMNNVSIYNATAGGLLDVFERVDYSSLFEKI